MMLYETGIKMLPRPPRSILSIGSEATRAMLPNFSSVQQLSQFTNRTMNWHLHTPHIYPQAVFCCSFIFFLILVVGFIMFRRIYEGRFWLIRVVHRRTGVILVPNPILAFLVMAGLCVIIYTPFFLVTIRQYVLHTAPPRNIVLWFTLPWLAVAYGLIWAAWGTHFATPSSMLSTLEESKLHFIRRFFRHASVINSLCLLIPITMTGAIVGPAVVANRQYEKAITMERAWQAMYAAEVDFSQIMVQQSQEIWYQVLKACKTAAVVFSLWTAFAFMMSISYFYVSVKLIMVVHEDLATVEEMEAPQVQAAEAVVTVAQPSKVPKIVADALQANRKPGQHQERLLTSSFQIRSALYQDLPMTQCDNFAINETTSPAHNHRKSLKEALFQIYIQLLGIGPAAAIFGAVALTFVLTLYSGLEQSAPDGGNRFEHYIGGIWLALLYLICAAGALNSLPVAFKAYENSIHSVKAASPNLQAGTPISFMDVKKGATHIKTTFFETPSATTLPMTLPASPPKALIRKTPRAGAAMMTLVDDDEDQYSWDLGGGPSYNSANTWPSPSSATKFLR